MKQRLLTTTALALGAVLSSLPATASAADQEPAQARESGTGKDQTVTDLAYSGEVFTITATRNPMPAFDYPGSVSVITTEEIEDKLASSIADIFDEEPGVRFDGGPRRTGETPSIRGIEGEGVVILFDGVRQSFISGHDGRFFIEPDLVAQADVVRGPSSALYGSGALGGVIALRTLDASHLLGEGERFGYRLGAGYQDVNGESRLGGTVFGRSADGRFDGLASLTRREAGDISLGNGLDLTADDELLSGLVKGSARLTQALRLEASWNGYTDDAVEPNNGQGANEGDLVEKEIRSDSWRGALSFNPAGNNLVDAGLILYANEASVDEDEVDSDRTIGRTVESTGIVFDNRSRFALSPAASLTVTYGGEYYEDEQTGTDNNTADGTRGGVPDASAETTSLFAQAELDIETGIGRFSFIPAVRHDSFSSSSPADDLEIEDDATSAKAGLAWRPAQWALLYANYAEAFRAPSFNELFADDIHFVIPLGPGVEAENSFIPNPDLQSEESTSWEIGGGVQFAGLFAPADSLQVKAGYYASDVDNLIDLNVDFAFSPGCFAPGASACNAGTSNYANVANARLEGWELEADYDNARYFASVNFSSIDGENRDTGEYVGILSPNRLNVNWGVKFPEIDTKIGIRTELAADHDKVNDPAQERDGYLVSDIYASWAPATGSLAGLRIDAGFDNVFDEAYERSFAGVLAPGRNAKLAIRWTATY
ncbi:TonB-dependent hemoglobin/transferrin/lactoferrin family receptor [Aquisalinus flavus]|uniref:Ligand-gated channel protein n=1 Tax=Aquisalinus flavus TaxID=1526572 RepID=A0A8J2V223_9PROT|nr:TonB-dependent hemoglobin/transferrin/lactoferrin family receptor [Aquisalinus flavus]MBD0427018.1 TonB-dependent hemoglobin/transferrin/lactoferrin family receptor [Aquisalinus flavus]UNE46848.1 TonB-dependent hemoglobin/transferrin/lactoferrin family receptor [Aquisalinus flavus]GGC97712.1 ligand-gated channel protein [Aquisalinus flavus]